MIMHGTDFSATSIEKTPLFDHMTSSERSAEQTLVSPRAKSSLSALQTLVDAPFLRSQRMTGSEKLRCGVNSSDE
jgi:hypothetical protein